MPIAALRPSRFALAAAFAAAALVTGPLRAQTPPAETPAQGAPAQPGGGAEAGEVEPKQIPLTPKSIENFIAAWPEFEALREKLQAASPQAKDQNPNNQPESDEAEVGEAEDPIGALATYLDNPDAKRQIEDILKKHQFGTYAEWADVAQSVLLAFGASDPDGGETDLSAEKKKVQGEIENDAALSDDEKKSALKDLDEQFAALESFQPLPGNVEAVKPYLPKIKQLFGDDGQN